MKNPKIELWVRSRVNPLVSMEQRHAEFLHAMAEIGPPLGFEGLTLPASPDCRGKLIADFAVKLPTRGIQFSGYYQNRIENYAFSDNSRFDDFIRYGFSASSAQLDYQLILQNEFPRVVAAFAGYSASVIYDEYLLAYCGGFVPSEDGTSAFDDAGNQIRNNEVYNRLLADPAIDVNGRNNIYVLGPAQYWDNELCVSALSFTVDEVARRLSSTDARVTLLEDGVYIVFNDNPYLTYNEFVGLNNKYKPILGLE